MAEGVEEDEHHKPSRQEIDEAKKRLDKQIARAMAREMQMLIDWCLYEKSVEIVSVQFNDSPNAPHIELQIRWPFALPNPTGDPDDPIPTESKAKEFSNNFQGYLLKQRAGRRLANLLYGEFVEYLLIFLKYHRFPESAVRELRGLGERRLSGRPTPNLDAAQKLHIQKEGRGILARLLEMKNKIRGWKKKEKGIDDETIKDRVSQQYDRDDFPWMRYFAVSIRNLPPIRTGSNAATKAGSRYRRTQLSEPQSWSASGLTARILQTALKRESGTLYSLNEIQHLVSQAAKKSTRPPTK